MEAKQKQNPFSLGNFPLNASKVIKPAKDHFPEILFSRERLYQAMQTENSSKLVPVVESFPKRLISTCMEYGLREGLVVAQESESPLVVAIASKLLAFTNYIRSLLGVAKSESTMNLYAEHSQTRNWSKSVIRGLAWHPGYFKLAVATLNDTVCIYALNSSVTPVLKSDLQKSITCLAWRPGAGDELAIGCENGVLIWHVDPNSQLSRPVVPPLVLQHRGNKYRPVSDLSWSKNGELLATTSVIDTCIYVWNVDQQHYESLRSINSPCALVNFVPSGDQLLVTTISRMFFIGDIKRRIKPNYWNLSSGPIQSFAWSKQHNHLLYVTQQAQELFHMQVGPKYANLGCPIVDLKRAKTDDGVMAGGFPQCIAWCPQDYVLAISFKDTAVIAVFLTIAEPCNFSIIPYCFITGLGLSYPCCMVFQENYTKLTGKDATKSVLTVGWSTGSIMYYLFREYCVQGSALL